MKNEEVRKYRLAARLSEVSEETGVRLHLNSSETMFMFLWTPDYAEVALLCNENNLRNIRLHTVHKYAKDIASEEWHDEACRDPIVFTRQGGLPGLANGQHRMAAVVRAEKSVWMRTVLGDTGKQISVQYTDTNVPRTISVTHGLSSAKAATASLLIALEMGSNKTLTRNEIVERYTRSMYAIDAVVLGFSSQRRWRSAPIHVAFVMALEGLAEGKQQQQLARVRAMFKEVTSTKRGATYGPYAVTFSGLMNSVDARVTGNRDRLIFSCKLLNVLSLCADGLLPPRSVYSTSKGLLRFCPDARYRPPKVNRKKPVQGDEWQD